MIDEQQRRLFSKRLPNSLDHILAALQPFKDQLAGVVVESTYNWYWLVDGLQEAGYRVHLANPSAIRQYEGLKHTDDQSDAFWLAQQLLLGILPQGYIYPKSERPTRDLLRRRSLFVRHRTAHILSLQSMVQRCCGHGISANEIKKLTLPEASALFSDPQLGLTARFQVETIGFLSQQIRSIEKAVLPQVKLRPEFEILLTIPGIGQILGLTIMLEVGDIRRFAKAGNYASYCRCVKSQKLSDTKKKGIAYAKKIAARPAATRHLQRLLALKRDYPAQAFDSAIARGLQYGVYDLSRLEKLVLRVVAGDFFKLGESENE